MFINGIIVKKVLGCVLAFFVISSPIYAGWYSEKVVDAITDEESLVIISDEGNVLIRCEFRNDVYGEGQSTFVAFLVPDGKKVFDSARVLYRFDKEPHDSISLDELRSSNGLALIFSKAKFENYKKDGGVLYRYIKEDFEFIRNMMEKERLLIRIPTGSTDTDLEINLDGLSEVLTPNVEYCGLDVDY